MSNVLYPSAMIEAQSITPFDSVLRDEFEGGETQSRRIWAAQEYKHRIEAQTSRMTRAEWWRLRSFLNQRGTFDSFWYRDNLDRTGNYNVRLRQLPARQFDIPTFQPRLELEEVAPRRHLPELDEVITAAGAIPKLWYDPNREFYALEAGEPVVEDETWDESFNDHRAAWQGGNPLLLTGAEDAQYQSFHFEGSEWALCDNYAHGSTGNQPPITLFLFAKFSTVAAQQILLAYGDKASGDCLGIQADASNNFSPYDADGTSWGSAVQSNGTADTWRSLAVTSALSSNDVSFYANAALKATVARTRTQAATNVSLGAMTDGTLKCSAAGANCEIAHALIFGAALSLAQIKAVHNLFAYQFGVATVS